MKTVKNLLAEALQSMDNRIDTSFDRLRGNKIADRLFYTASALGDHGLIWTQLAAVRYLRATKRIDQKIAVRAVAVAGVESFLVNIVMKSIFQRKRPVDNTTHPLPLRTPLTSSFPSGHSTAAMCSSVLLAQGDSWWPFYYIIAVIVAVSRIYVRKHHPSDVLGGAIIGVILGVLGRKIHPL